MKLVAFSGVRNSSHDVAQPSLMLLISSSSTSCLVSVLFVHSFGVCVRVCGVAPSRFRLLSHAHQFVVWSLWSGQWFDLSANSRTHARHLHHEEYGGDSHMLVPHVLFVRHHQQHDPVLTYVRRF